MGRVRYLMTAATHFFAVFLIVGSYNYVKEPHFLKENANFINYLIISTLLAAFTFPFMKTTYFGKIKTQNRAVLITGCDSGFGHMLAKHLAANGFYVYASCLFPSGKGAKDLSDACPEQLRILEMDVSSDESVNNAKKIIAENLGTRELWALVNNAGILKGLSVEFTDIQDYRDCLEVNTIGTVRVTKAFLPFLKQSRGRIVNVTSLGGRVTLPFFSPYLMSKFAAVAFTDCLRTEMSVWGIRVIAIEPECFKTPIADLELTKERVDKIIASIPDDLRNDYGETYFKKFKKMVYAYASTPSSKVEKVVMALDSAISLEYPDDVYYPARNAPYGMGIHFLKLIPKSIQTFVINTFLYTIYSLTPERVKRRS